MTSKRYPIPIVRGEVAHATKEQCLSPSTESHNILVLQSGDYIVFDDPQQRTLRLRMINDCIGNKAEIENWIRKIKDGKFKNVDPNSIEPAPTFDKYMKLPSEEFWYRFYSTFIYRDKLDGSYSFLKDVELRYISSLIINDGKEYFYLTGPPSRIISYNWENTKDKLENKEIYRQTNFRKCKGVSNEVSNVRALQIASGVFNVAPDFVPRFVRDSLITRTGDSIRRRIRSKNVYNDLSIIEVLLPLTQTQEDLFIELYDQGFLKSRITGKQKASFSNILESIQKKYDYYPSLRSINSISALSYHINLIERILNKINKFYINAMINIEVELVYQILMHLRTEYNIDKISWEKKVRFER